MTWIHWSQWWSVDPLSWAVKGSLSLLAKGQKNVRPMQSAKLQAASPVRTVILSKTACELQHLNKKSASRSCPGLHLNFCFWTLAWSWIVTCCDFSKVIFTSRIWWVSPRNPSPLFLRTGWQKYDDIKKHRQFFSQGVVLIWLDSMHLWEDGVELSRDFQEKVWSLIQEDVGICIRFIGIFVQLTAHKIKVTGDWHPWRKFHAIGMCSPCRQAVQRAAVSHHIWRELAPGLANCIKLHTANLRMLTHSVFL